MCAAADLSPLQEIERRVQRRAKEISLEMTTGEGQSKLRGLIDQEVAAWSTDHKRGLRTFDLAEPELVAERAYRNLAGYGPLEALLADDDVWEVMVRQYADLRGGGKALLRGLFWLTAVDRR